MLAGKLDLTTVTYPLGLTPKFDGIRSFIKGSSALTRSLKHVPNRYIRNLLSKPEFEGFDGELMGSNILGGQAFIEATKAIMTHDGEPDFKFYVFDLVIPGLPWVERKEILYDLIEECQEAGATFLEPVRHVICKNQEELNFWYREFLKMQYEGAIINKLDAPYKYGRSTTKEGYLLKYKPYEDSEAEIIGFEELMHNENPAKVNELGRTARSSSKKNKVGLDSLGTLICRDLYSGEEVRIGTGIGLTTELRKLIWLNKDFYLGQIIRYYFSPPTKTKPRQAIMQGFRDKTDL